MEALYFLSLVLMVGCAHDGDVVSSAFITTSALNAAADTYLQQALEDDDYKETFSQCEFMKKLFGVSYDQLQGAGELALLLNNLTLVYRTKNGTKVFSVEEAVESLSKRREVDEEERLVIFVHGFTDSPTKQAFTTMTQVFLAAGHTDLIALDASSVLSWFYLRSTAYVHFIGQKLGRVLAALAQQGQDPSAIHIIGHSLGAHIAGFAGKAFRELTGESIGRISGLDPAGPCFKAVHPDARLQRTDAAFVSVLHTDHTMFGIKEAVGHKDYYPNGGSLQPNCMLLGCSHVRAWVLYAESVVTPLAFPAVRCKDWDAFKKGQCESEISYMGHASKATGSDGHYFLQTGGKSPYGLGLTGTLYKKTSLFC